MPSLATALAHGLPSCHCHASLRPGSCHPGVGRPRQPTTMPPTHDDAPDHRRAFPPMNVSAISAILVTDLSRYEVRD